MFKTIKRREKEAPDFTTLSNFPPREISLKSFLTYSFCLSLVVSFDTPDVYWEGVENAKYNGELTFHLLLCRKVKGVYSI